MKKTKKRINELKKQGFYNNWNKIKLGPINFYMYPEFNTEKEWLRKRTRVYGVNAKKFHVKTPNVNFYVYPSKEIGDKLGIIPAISFIKSKEIHGHLNQSPGHELTHILMGKINVSENLPGNGLWQEGVCTYLNGTKTNQRKHALSLNLSPEILNTPWKKWTKHMPESLYPIAGSIIQYIVKCYDWKKLIRFLKLLKDLSKNQDQISKLVFRSSLKDIQNDWQKWLKKGD